MDSPRGLRAAREYPLWDAIVGRRSRRVAAGAAFRSGSLSFQSKLDPQPLSRLEEAFLIAATSVTGLPHRDNPYETAEGKPLVGTPCVEGSGRAAGSPDNAQSTVFFVWNDEGTYMLKKPDGDGPHRYIWKTDDRFFREAFLQHRPCTRTRGTARADAGAPHHQFGSAASTG